MLRVTILLQTYPEPKYSEPSHWPHIYLKRWEHRPLESLRRIQRSKSYSVLRPPFLSWTLTERITRSQPWVGPPQGSREEEVLTLGLTKRARNSQSIDSSAASCHRKWQYSSIHVVSKPGNLGVAWCFSLSFSVASPSPCPVHFNP